MIFLAFKVEIYGQVLTYHKKDNVSISLMARPLIKINTIQYPSLDNQKSMTTSVIFLPKYTHQAFFCKMEDKIFNTSKTNLKINLGSNSYVNFLEGKNKYY